MRVKIALVSISGYYWSYPTCVFIPPTAMPRRDVEVPAQAVNRRRDFASNGHLSVVFGVTGAGPSDVATLKQADCGVGPEGAAIDAQSAADIVFLKPGISTIVENIELSRKTFRKIYTYKLCRTSVTLHFMVELTRPLLKRDDFINSLFPMMTGILILDIIGMNFSWAEDSFSCPPVPCRWNGSTFFRRTLILTICLTSATVLKDFTAIVF